MKINIINPNTCQGMTDKIAETARQCAGPSVSIVASSPKHGPLSIENAFDETIAAAAMLDEIIARDKEGVDAHIIACFGDPGLDAAREIANAPVIGVADASFKLANLVSHKFGIVTTMTQTIPLAKHLLHKYGYERSCSGVRATDIPVLALEKIDQTSYNLLLSECQRSIELDGAEAIVLGCAGMTDLVNELSQQLRVPVIDGVTAAVKLAESLVSLGLSTSKKGQYKTPVSKQYIGRYAHLSAVIAN
ncbi:aspartate/glutamate racemase family protein [Vibrio sp. 10N.261.51.F12]|uniref:aspartate/glutamate racemase family protein n=1 Tax=Vibrio sp. 10N.261.51.F12 TaxID=3229679 RepID=UPI003551D661